ncbi:MAG: sulfatase-like hydrolase/transferase [Zavarzinella sp.]
MIRFTIAILTATVWYFTATSQSAEPIKKPNVLFIAVDDLNDWVGCMGGHPQAKTPNLDRLAKSGVLFTNAHCAAPSCNPSRTAIMTGMSPAKSGLYTNTQRMRDVLPDTKLLPVLLREQGYTALGSGKILHYFTDAKSWDGYYPEAKTESPIPFTLYPKQRPLSLPRAGPWQYIETDWGPLDATDEEYGGDSLVANYVGQQLAKKHDKPFFLACGLYRPHEPWFVPKKYFEPFPLDKIQLPPGYQENDLDDLSAEGKRRGANRYFAHIQEHKQWKQGIQGYLAAIYYSDAMFGRVLDALDKSPHKDNTIVVLWSDHGWHLGEKQHWQKYTAWRACTRVPLMIRVPQLNKPAVCDRPVNLVSLMPTILELTGLPAHKECDGPSLVPLLKNPAGEWKHISVTYLDTPGSFGLSTDHWRYIKYHTGDEELYDIQADPYEWTNLAGKPEHREKLNELRKIAPTVFAKVVEPEMKAIAMKKPEKEIPPSKPEGAPATIQFVNSLGQPVRIYWVNPNGERKLYAEVKPNDNYRQNIRKGAVWLITDTKDTPVGYFVGTGVPVKAVIRK